MDNPENTAQSNPEETAAAKTVQTQPIAPDPSSEVQAPESEPVPEEHAQIAAESMAQTESSEPKEAGAVPPEVVNRIEAASTGTTAEEEPAASEASPIPVPTAVEGTAPSGPDTPPTITPRDVPSGPRRFASQGRREGRENAEEITDPRMRRPAVFEPRSGPSHSRFNPRQPVAEVDPSTINYKNVTVLMRFIDNQGRILSRRKSRVDAKTQRRIKTAIKQARHLALLPYTPSHIQSQRRR